tara:strand:+ start:858 stop:1277 length:420 start_codon:yes stop_codon:yes gene_type:complete
MAGCGTHNNQDKRRKKEFFKGGAPESAGKGPVNAQYSSNSGGSSVSSVNNYSKLGSYVKGKNYGAVPTSLNDPRMAKADPKQVKFVLPEYGGVGYDILQHGCASGDDSGYFSINKAYPGYPGQCGKPMCGKSPMSYWQQ